MIFDFKLNAALKKHILVKKSQVHSGWNENNLDFQTKPENNPDSKPEFECRANMKVVWPKSNE